MAEIEKPAESATSNDSLAGADDAKFSSQVSDASIEDQLAELRKKLESADKRVGDTFDAFRRGQERIALLEQQLAHRAPVPELLEGEDGHKIKEAIQYVNTLPTEHDKWVSTVATALPDLDDLMRDQGFNDMAKAERQAIGERDWKDPILAIRGLAKIRTEYLQKLAVEKDRESYRTVKGKTDAMSIPGGSSRGQMDRETDGAERIWEMSSDEFEKERRRVKGY